MQALSTVHPMAELTAPPAWRTVDFISDLHLNAGEPATFTAWRQYLQTTPADAVFMLGDLFEVWVGDDVLDSGTPAPDAAPVVPGSTNDAAEPFGEALAIGDQVFSSSGQALTSTNKAASNEDSACNDDAIAPATANFEQHCAQVLHQAGERLALFFMPGNRDFLVGQYLMKHARATLLADPTVLTFAGQRWLLTHGDALCLDDADYLKFRQQVRSPGWQSAFLAKPLAERQAMARHMRQQSQAHQQAAQGYADVDGAAARQWLHAAGAATLIHGHTHKPGAHELGGGLRRLVLSDWDAQARPPRADALRLSASGPQRIAVLAP